MDLAGLQRLAATRPAMFALAGGLPAAEQFPRQELARAFAVALRRTSTLQYGWPEGSPTLRGWIAARLRARGADVDADDVIVTHGAQQALSIVSVLLLPACAHQADARPGEVEVDAETYPGALQVVRERGARAVARSDAPACCYVMPGVANPTGLGLADERRRHLLSRRVPLVVDEAYAELRFDGVEARPLLAEARDRTWHIGTFSKTLCPGLRVGYLVPPRVHRASAVRLKHVDDLQAGSLAQAVLEELLCRDDFDARLARARTFYGARADALTTSLRRHLPSLRVRAPEGGFSVFAESDRAGDERSLLEAAIAEGVSFDPGSLFRADAHAAHEEPLAMRLCFSAHGPRALDEAVRRLARAWDRHARRA